MQEYFDLKWTGQGLAALTLNTIELLMKPKRQTVDHHRKFGILKAQKHQCNICGMNLVMGDVQMDHVARNFRSYAQSVI